MIRPVLARIVSTIPVLLGIAVISFFLIRLVPGDVVNIMMGDESVTFDAGYWAEHDAEFIEQTEGFDGYEAAYGNFTDYDAVSQGFYDDDPNPYSGTYSEM